MAEIARAKNLNKYTPASVSKTNRLWYQHRCRNHFAKWKQEIDVSLVPKKTCQPLQPIPTLHSRMKMLHLTSDLFYENGSVRNVHVERLEPSPIILITTHAFVDTTISIFRCTRAMNFQHFTYFMCGRRIVVLINDIFVESDTISGLQALHFQMLSKSFGALSFHSTNKVQNSK